MEKSKAEDRNKDKEKEKVPHSEYSRHVLQVNNLERIVI